MRAYSCIGKTSFEWGTYQMIPIRDMDMYDIMHWRNEQIEILRQKELLTKENQEWYFENVIAKLFETDKPGQLLFSFLENGDLIGYGGLVHIDWESANAEISFLTSLTRTKNPAQFRSDWISFLNILEEITFKQLNFLKLYTYAYSFRTDLFPILEEKGFVLEAQLRKHVIVNSALYDVVIHSKFNINN